MALSRRGAPKLLTNPPARATPKVSRALFISRYLIGGLRAPFFCKISRKSLY